jgi:acetone carboxylase gamma subunit
MEVLQVKQDQKPQVNVLIIGPSAGKPKDYPFSEIAKSVKREADLGHLCYQKFTCAGCGQRLTMEAPNVLYRTGTCDKCGHVTDIEAQGCNFMIEMHNMTLEQVASKFRQAKP